MSNPRYAYDLRAHPVSHREVRLSDLKISDRAQRAWERVRSTKYARNFVLEAVGTLVVSRRADGSMYIVDGMHRWHACRDVGIDTLTVEIHHGLTEQEEAILFLLKNRESKKPASREEYKVALTAGVPLYVDTDAVLTKHGLSIGNTTSKNKLGAVTTILNITRRYGPDALDRSLSVMEAAWGRDESTWDSVVISGVGMFIGRHGDQINDDELANKLSGWGPAIRWRGEAIAQCKGGGGGGGSRMFACYNMIVEVWNKRRRKDLIVP